MQHLTTGHPKKGARRKPKQQLDQCLPCWTYGFYWVRSGWSYLHGVGTTQRQMHHPKAHPNCGLRALWETCRQRTVQRFSPLGGTGRFFLSCCSSRHVTFLFTLLRLTSLLPPGASASVWRLPDNTRSCTNLPFGFQQLIFDYKTILRAETWTGPSIKNVTKTGFI